MPIENAVSDKGLSQSNVALSAQAKVPHQKGQLGMTQQVEKAEAIQTRMAGAQNQDLVNPSLAFNLVSLDDIEKPSQSIVTRPRAETTITDTASFLEALEVNSAPSIEAKDTQGLSETLQVGQIDHLPLWHTIKPETIEFGIKTLLHEVSNGFKQLETITDPTWHNLVSELEQLERKLSMPMNRLNHLKSVCYTEALREAIDAIEPEVIALQTQMGQSRALFDGLTQLQQAQILTPVQQKVIENRLTLMKHKGVGLDGDQQQRFIEIQQALTKLGSDFSSHLVEQTQEVRVKEKSKQALVGIPEAILEVAAKQAQEDGESTASAQKGPWHFKIDGQTFKSVMEQGKNSEFREKFYRAYKKLGISQGKDNRPVLKKILELKQEKARLLGFENAATASLDIKMAPSISAVYQLLDQLKDAAIPVAEQELKTLEKFARTQHPDMTNLNPWDVSFWTEQYVKNHYNIDQEVLRQYLQVPRVMDSLFNLMQEMFGLEIKQVPTVDLSQSESPIHEIDQRGVPVWHKDVAFYEIKEKGEVVAGFFIDPYARPGAKEQGAWMDSVVDKSMALASTDRDASIPVALMVMNARPPQTGKPGLFSLYEMETLFHEFGHALQHMLTKIKEGDVSGINGVEWDAVEVASQLNENWVYQPDFLKAVSQHVDTAEPLDDETIQKIIDARHYFSGNATLRQLFFAKTDMRLHEEIGLTDQEESITPDEIEQQVRKELIRTPYLEEETALPSFGHIFGGDYGAGYYSYKWAEVIAADAFAAFEEAGLDNPEKLAEVASKYRQTILAEGGARPAVEVYRAFRGRDATPEALLKQQGLI